MRHLARTLYLANRFAFANRLSLTAGVQALKLVLTHREAEPAAKLGSRAVPTQEMLRAMMAGASVTKVPTTSREAQRRERLAKQAALNTEIDDLLDNELDEILEGL